LEKKLWLKPTVCVCVCMYVFTVHGGGKTVKEAYTPSSNLNNVICHARCDGKWQKPCFT